MGANASFRLFNYIAMDKILTAKIGLFLQLKDPTEEQIREGATLLLRCNPNRERGIYNNAMRRPKAMLPWIRTDLKKYYDIRQRGLTTSEVEKYNRETVKAVRETLARVPSDVKVTDDHTPNIPQLGVRGKRPDHDSLPMNIQSLWDKNAERWLKMRKMHAQLAQMIARPGYAACDGNELCFQLRQIDTELRNDYERYDTYVAEDKKEMSSADSVEKFTDNVKIIQNARTQISRGVNRKTPHTEASLQKLQDAVNTLHTLNQVIKPETADKLKALGIVIPQHA